STRPRPAKATTTPTTPPTTAADPANAAQHRSNHELAAGGHGGSDCVVDEVAIGNLAGVGVMDVSGGGEPLGVGRAEGVPVGGADAGVAGAELGERGVDLVDDVGGRDVPVVGDVDEDDALRVGQAAGHRELGLLGELVEGVAV